MKTAELQAVDLTWCGNDFYVENLLFLCAPKEKVAKRKCASQGRKAVVDETLSQPEAVCAGKETSLFLLPAAAIHGGLCPLLRLRYFTNKP